MHQKKSKILFFFLLSTFLTVNFAHAGAWSMGKGKMYNKLALNYFYSDQFYDSNNDKQDLPFDGEFTDMNLNWYMQYGLTSKIDVIASLYYKWLRDENKYLKYESDDAGDIDLGIKYNFLKDPVVLSVQGLYKLRGPYDMGDSPQIGNGQDDFELRLLFGKSLYPLPMYFGLEGGYRWRFDEPSDEWRFLVELGGSYGDFYARAKLDGIISANNADEVNEGFTVSNISLTPQFDLIKLDLTAGYNLSKRCGVELSYVPTIYGENTAAGYTISTAIIFSF